jgi:hypothetical protein
MHATLVEEDAAGRCSIALYRVHRCVVATRIPRLAPEFRWCGFARASPWNGWRPTAVDPVNATFVDIR